MLQNSQKFLILCVDNAINSRHINVSLFIFAMTSNSSNLTKKIDEKEVQIKN